MISIEEINNLQKDIDRKDRIIKVLKERVRQWVKEYNILDGIIEMYKMSENEANEIIAELKAENERLKEEIKYLEEEKKEKIQLLEQIINILYPNANDDELFTVTFNGEYIDKLKKIHQTLQEIKAIAEKTIDIYYPDYYDEGFEEDIVTEFAKQVLDLITKAEEEWK